jgi:hypothetical protein
MNTFRYLVIDDFGDSIRKFMTKHEAMFYVLNKPDHKIKKLDVPKINVFDLIKDEPLF